MESKMNSSQLKYHMRYRDICVTHGGRLLSETYVNARTKVWVECGVGHNWEVLPSDLNRGRWCSVCSHKRNGDKSRKTIEELQSVANERGGRLISTEYINCWTKVEWECEANHHWIATWNSIKAGSWCFVCAHNKLGESQKVPISEVQALAEERGGKLLSEVYIDRITKMEFVCNLNHRWFTTYATIQSGSWCPVCRKSRGERTISELLTKWSVKYQEQYTIDILPRKRFDIQLEYRAINHLVEFDGRQHFERVPFFDKCKSLEDRQASDILKTRTALTLGYKLIRIDHTKEDEIEQHLINGVYGPNQLYLSTPSMYDWLTKGIQPVERKTKMTIIEPKLTLKIIDG